MRLPILGALLVLVIAPGCGDDSPTGPSPTGGITLYVDPDLRGESRVTAEDIGDLTKVSGGCVHESEGFIPGTYVTPIRSIDWNDCISSIRVPQGWSVTVYEDTNYRGQSQTFTGNVNDLEDVRGPCGDDWDDCVSSLRVTRP